MVGSWSGKIIVRCRISLSKKTTTVHLKKFCGGKNKLWYRYELILFWIIRDGRFDVDFCSYCCVCGRCLSLAMAATPVQMRRAPDDGKERRRSQSFPFWPVLWIRIWIQIGSTQVKIGINKETKGAQNFIIQWPNWLQISLGAIIFLL